MTQSLAAAGSLAMSSRNPGSVFAAPNDRKKPNIVYIMADDLGYGDVGCYGQRTLATPHIDRLAEEGVRFTDAYAGSTVCAPSRCTLMTGYHTGHCYIRGNARIPLPAEQVTVAEILQKAGYRTGLFGKWGLGNPDTEGVPNRQGFDEFFGYLDQGHAHNYYPEHLWHNEEMVEIQPNLGMGRRVYSHDLIAEKALEFIDNHKEVPFFLYLAFTLPHANNERGRYEGNGMEIPDYGSYKDKDWPDPQKGHAAMIEKLDREVGRVMEKLVDLGIDENTLVFFTSDNGPHKEGGADPEFFDSSGPLQGYKRSLHEGGIRVPMIARWPARIQAGRTSDFPWANWDFLPTAAEIAGQPIPEGIDGISILPTLLGTGEGEPHEFLYWEFHEQRFAQAVRSGKWKAIRYQMSDPIELYNLEEDLAEENDVSESHPEIVEKMRGYFDSARTKSEHWKVRVES
jgi:arylsulfatase A-like enzyme